MYMHSEAGTFVFSFEQTGLLDDAALNMAEVMGTTGMYKEALEQLGQIDRKPCLIISILYITTCIVLFTV